MATFKGYGHDSTQDYGMFDESDSDEEKEPEKKDPVYEHRRSFGNGYGG